MAAEIFTDYDADTQLGRVHCSPELGGAERAVLSFGVFGTTIEAADDNGVTTYSLPGSPDQAYVDMVGNACRFALDMAAHAATLAEV